MSITELSNDAHDRPMDTFAVRLAIIRNVMDWNYHQAGNVAGVTGAAWRNWEKNIRRCTDILGVSRKVAAATGFSEEWLVFGGPLIPGEKKKPRQFPDGASPSNAVSSVSRPQQDSNLQPTD